MLQVAGNLANADDPLCDIIVRTVTSDKVQGRDASSYRVVTHPSTFSPFLGGWIWMTSKVPWALHVCKYEVASRGPFYQHCETESLFV